MTFAASTRPLISVIIPTYRRANDLDRALRSVLAESGDGFEVVVGDDASPDHTSAVVAAYSEDSRLRHYRNEINLGMQENVLKVARMARGDYLFILTDDDWLTTGALAKVAATVRAYPEAGYVLSHLRTVDERTGRTVDIHRTTEQAGLIPVSLANLAHIAPSAWVLSRQVLKREAIDWATWEKFKMNIFFPIIVAGRILMHAPCYYLTDFLVEHTGFNQVFWDKFGRDRLDIEFNLARDHYQCMSAILFDQQPTAEVQATIDMWENSCFRGYLDLAPFGFYDLIKSNGLPRALAQLKAAYPLNAERRRILNLWPLRLPFLRIWVNAKAIVRWLSPATMVALKRAAGRGHAQYDW